jgi:hypothetical protein
MTLEKDVLSTPTGFIAKDMGWFGFFITVPSLVATLGMLLKFAPWRTNDK